ncbi:trypsin-like serine protease [Lentzea sp. NEAU-D7]|uniref:trypsin-like serine protease n=1 Tax=Lentzea sp. NEAU-D7 TaxID=2994667 RepID=UPI00224A5055|nr:trypsin-like serine protease [Lentzea sp. NEAU-D7]MCX2948675.1 trypsin-like serine protease [Lentzea sp. NEAU-D7]MCX2951233.1 trypsin-like serine protease [Lentzea sp. NEAU-D7]
MTRTPRSWGLLALVAATVLTPVGIANAAPPNAPAANYLGDTVPANLGDASPMFVGGQSATVSEFPGIIAGIRAGGTRPEGQTCTGTVVAPRKILIAAHCADAQGEKKFVYGLDDLKDYQGGAGTGFAVNVVSYKKHPKYVNFDQGYDVAVVTVDRDIALKGGAAYPKFATSADAGGAAPGKTGLGFGYGKKDFNDNSQDVTLDKASLPVVNGDSVCQGVGAGFKSATMICAGYSDGRISILPGDSGGPLIFDGKIYGVASWSRSDFKWYSIYGRLDNEMGDWVKTEVGEQPPVGDFGLTVAPGSGSVAAGKTVSAGITTTAGSGGAENATLSASGLPSGVKAVFQPTSVTTGNSAKVTFEASTSAPNGTYEVTVGGTTTSGKTASGKYSLTVTGGGDPQPGDFTLGASPSSVKAAKGKYVSTTISSSGDGRTITLSASGVPSGVKATFQPSSVGAGGSSKLTLDVSSTATAGTTGITVTGTDAGGKTATTTVSLTVEGSEPPTGEVAVTASPSSASVRQGMLAQTLVKAAGGTGNLTLTASGVPTGAQMSFNPATIGQNGSSNVWVFTNFSTPPGTYPITIKATSADGKTGTTTFTLTVTR